MSGGGLDMAGRWKRSTGNSKKDSSTTGGGGGLDRSHTPRSSKSSSSKTLKKFVEEDDELMADRQLLSTPPEPGRHSIPEWTPRPFLSPSAQYLENAAENDKSSTFNSTTSTTTSFRRLAASTTSTTASEALAFRKNSVASTDAPVAAPKAPDGTLAQGLRREDLSNAYQELLGATGRMQQLDTPGRLAFLTKTIKRTCAKKPENRTEDELSSMEKLLSRDLAPDFFGKFRSPASRRALCSLLRHETYSRGDVIFHQGDFGEHFYIILSGRVSVTMDTRQRPSDQVSNKQSQQEENGAAALLRINTSEKNRARSDARVGRLKRGDAFGEIALIANEKRTATCTALEPVDLLSLHKDDFNAVYTKVYGVELQGTVDFLKTINFFEGVSHDDLMAWAPHFHQENFPKGNVFQLDNDGLVHFVMEGNLAIVRPPIRAHRIAHTRRGTMPAVLYRKSRDSTSAPRDGHRETVSAGAPQGGSADMPRYAHDPDGGIGGAIDQRETGMPSSGVSIGGSGDGSEILTHIGPGQIFGYSTLFPQHQRGWTVVSQSSCLILTCERTAFLTHVQESVLSKIKIEADFKIQYFDSLIEGHKKRIYQLSERRPSLKPMLDNRYRRPSIFAIANTSVDDDSGLPSISSPRRRFPLSEEEFSPTSGAKNGAGHVTPRTGLLPMATKQSPLSGGSRLPLTAR
ncbi:cyclic nucleotide-binding domain-containing protein [Pseudoscourfieldia marina]